MAGVETTKKRIREKKSPETAFKVSELKRNLALINDAHYKYIDVSGVLFGFSH
jgi:hypothetical protein